MDRQAFKQRMQDLKSYRENNPGKGYWDWKVDAFDDGGVNGNLVGSYSNHTGTPTMYVPVTKEYEATPDGFGEIANVHTPEVVITPQSNISLEEAVDKGRRDAAPYVGAIVAGAALPAMSSTGGLGAAMDLSGIITDPLDPTNYLGFGVIKGLKKYKNRNSNALDYHLARLFNNNENNVGTGLELANNRTGKKLTQNDVINSSQFKNSLNPKLIKDYYNAARSIGTDKVNSAIFAPLAYIRSNYRDPYFAVNGNIYKNPLANFTSKGRKYKKSTGNKITDIDESIIASHELDHAVNKPSQAGRQSVLEWFNDNSQDVYFSKNNSTELAARGTQIKDWLKMSRNRDITTDELRNAAKNYVKDTGLDNNMTEMFDKIYDWEKAAKWFSQYASAIAAPVILSNTTESFVDGGQTGDPDMEKFYQATGRSRSGRPLEEGLKPVFSLEDAANMTPIGDAISARDTYNAVKNRDWLSAGLAALTVLPFVPSGLRNVKAAARYIPTVNRTEQSLINQALGNISKKRDYLSDIANSRNRVLEDINTIPYRNRAEQADKIFGTNYSETYDLLDDLYQHRYFDLPEVQPKDMVASERLQAKPFAEERFNKTGVGAEPNEFDLWVNTGMYRDPMQLANHEMNHYTDYIISRNANTTINNNMLKQLENSLKQTDATSYYRKGTEQKAYMNQLRTMLKQNGDVQNLDEPVSSTLLKKYLDKMSDSDPIKKMFKQHKNINAYTKWFNTIPLLGTTALGANAYFNNNKDE